MKTSWVIALSTLLLVGGMRAQEGPVVAGGTGVGSRGRHMIIRHEMGTWWKNPDVVAKLQLSDAQVSQLNQVFYNHKLKLIDYGAEMEKQDLKLETLLDGDQPDENQVSTQVDQVLAARGKLEREFTMMNLDLRKQLSLEQWRQLKSMRGTNAPGDHFFMFRKKGLEPGPPDGLPIPPPLPPGLD